MLRQRGGPKLIGAGCDGFWPHCCPREVAPERRAGISELAGRTEPAPRGDSTRPLPPASTPTDVAVAALEHVRQAVENRDWDSIQPGLAVTVSGGVAAVRTGESVTDLVRRADAALYEAGRNRIVLAGWVGSALDAPALVQATLFQLAARRPSRTSRTLSARSRPENGFSRRCPPRGCHCASRLHLRSRT
jgi:hypothetical protein